MNHLNFSAPLPWMQCSFATGLAHDFEMPLCEIREFRNKDDAERAFRKLRKQFPGDEIDCTFAEQLIDGMYVQPPAAAKLP